MPFTLTRISLGRLNSYCNKNIINQNALCYLSDYILSFITIDEEFAFKSLKSKKIRISCCGNCNWPQSNLTNFLCISYSLLLQNLHIAHLIPRAQKYTKKVLRKKLIVVFQNSNYQFLK